MDDPKIKIYAGSSGKRFARRMCDYLGVELGATETHIFSEGNTYVKIGEHVRGDSVYLVQPIALDANNEFVELLFWMDAFKRSGAAYVTAIIPYFGYAKGDKKDEPRVSIRARVCAECIEIAGADRIITMDLHAAQIQGFFKKPVDHLYSRPILVEYLSALTIDNAVIVSPDAGFAKSARRYSEYLGLPTAIGDKARRDHQETAEILEIIGEVEGKNAIIVDDFSISGGTLVDLARTLKARGALRIFACLCHAPLSAEGIAAIEASSIERVITTDSIDNPAIRSSPRFKLLSVAPLIAEAVRRMEQRVSISGLFEDVTEELFRACL
jgi:ribose-phosphate pyrophosphokinase